MTEPRETARLIVSIESGETAEDRLAAALAVADIASVIIRPGSGRPLDAAAALPLMTLAQKRGAAALIADDARLARTLKADGVHVGASSTADAAYAEARDIVGTRGIVGIDAGASRHDAMSAGEAGADYVGFGIAAGAPDRDTARAERLELIQWWAEIFEVPCVAFDVATAEEAFDLALAGADFVATSLPAAAAAAEVQALVRAFAAALAEAALEKPEAAP